MERFSLEIPERDACNGIYSSMKAVVENRGNTYILDDDTREHIQQTARWLIDPNGTPGLLLCGLCGNGKTSLAQAVSWLIGYVTEKELGYSNRKKFRFVSAKKVCDCFVRNINEYDDLCRCEMLILDDLGEEAKEVLVYGQPHTPVVDLLCERYAQRRFTIVTTNLETDALRSKYGERVYDRLREMMTSVVFQNESYR
jgi:DNA replication protein DnaC